MQAYASALVARKLGEVAVGAFAHRHYIKRYGAPATPDELLIEVACAHPSAASSSTCQVP